VIEIDSEHAIVSFGGTNGPFDLVSDAAIGLSGINPILNFVAPQVGSANTYIKNLPYDNIVVTGHSLGGYLAADVTLGHDKVTECVVFDAPGRNDANVKWNDLFHGDRVEKITNYNAARDIVHIVGRQPGSTNPVPGAEGHDLINIINAWVK
jgi:pimeloyl-ACP methyl ester carboxylesterase